MVEVNASDNYLLGVEEEFVYGSYLTDAEDLGDLDVSLSFYRKETDGERFTALTL